MSVRILGASLRSKGARISTRWQGLRACKHTLLPLKQFEIPGITATFQENTGLVKHIGEAGLEIHKIDTGMLVTLILNKDCIFLHYKQNGVCAECTHL